MLLLGWRWSCRLHRGSPAIPGLQPTPEGPDARSGGRGGRRGQEASALLLCTGKPLLRQQHTRTCEAVHGLFDHGCVRACVCTHASVLHCELQSLSVGMCALLLMMVCDSTHCVCLRPQVFRKAFASSVTLGSGASLGPEAPSVELGANTAAVLAPKGLSKSQQRMLIAAGAAAGASVACSRARVWRSVVWERWAMRDLPGATYPERFVWGKRTLHARLCTHKLFGRHANKSMLVCVQGCAMCVGACLRACACRCSAPRCAGCSCSRLCAT